MGTQTGDRNHRGRRAFGLIEVIISTVIVGTMLVAALEAVALAKIGMQVVQRQSTGTYLAEDLMSEILQRDYADAEYGLGSFGRSEAEAATGDRSLFDDVDDYNGWLANPPQAKDGSELAEFAEWKRSVSVQWVSLLSGAGEEGEGQDAGDGGPSQPRPSNGETGVKMIVVTVRYHAAVVAELTALRTCGADLTGLASHSRGKSTLVLDDLAVDAVAFGERTIGNFNGGQ